MRLPALHGPLSTLDPDGMAMLESMGVWETHADGDELVEQASRAGDVHFVADGQVRVEMAQPSGRRLLLGLRGAGAVIGDLSVIEDGRRSASVVAVGEVTTLRVQGGDYLRLLVERPDTMFAVLREVARRLQAAERRLADLGAERPAVRLARQLLEHASSDDATLDIDGRVALPMDLEDLATWIGADVEDTKEAMASLQAAGLVAPWGSGCKIVDLDGLALAGLI